MSKENLLSTKQFATLCQTTKHTLIHYDEIGILKPNYVGENGYRYYLLSQTEIFEKKAEEYLVVIELPRRSVFCSNFKIDSILKCRKHI